MYILRDQRSLAAAIASAVVFEFLQNIKHVLGNSVFFSFGSLIMLLEAMDGNGTASCGAQLYSSGI
jgi:hypothetical protein